MLLTVSRMHMTLTGTDRSLWDTPPPPAPVQSPACPMFPHLRQMALFAKCPSIANFFIRQPVVLSTWQGGGAKGGSLLKF